MPSSAIRFALSRSSGLPASIQFSVRRVASTVQPRSIILWMASVISNSPLADGWICRAASTK